MKSWIAVPLVALVWSSQAPAQAPTAAQKQATLSWLYSLQKENGGFAPDARPGSRADLRATTSALRAIKYFGGKVKDKPACAKFVASCYDKVETGFAPTPGGKADALTTAVGLMAVKELNLPQAEYAVRPVVYLCAHAKKFEEIRLAAAAYEALGAKCELANNWIAGIVRTHNPDGTYGKGSGAARETASAVVTLLRLGADVEHRDNVLKVLKAGQHADGGWGKGGEGPDLETTYRVMRAFFMLKDHPQDMNACQEFVARCRRPDGSYAVRPGQEGSAGGTYFAGIILHWLDHMK
jgi:prenyltransferase beta subunit